MSKRTILVTNMLVFGVIPASSYTLLRFGIGYGFDLQRIDTDFIGTSIMILVISLLIGFLLGLRVIKNRNEQ